jgi:anti-sigma regulatory factor (Ser/Thr protein kinase)
MSDSALADDATNCSMTGPADADTAATFRKHLRRWLDDTVRINAQKVADVVLASYEALSNCAEHAYCNLGSAGGGLMTLDIRTDPAQETVQVCVSDQGCWLERSSAAAYAGRGRGLILMHGLADDCTVQQGTGGSTVCLHFHRCPALSRTGELNRSPV